MGTMNAETESLTGNHAMNATKTEMTYTADQIRTFETRVKISADSVGQLRACDVFRVVEHAYSFFRTAGEFNAFLDWLSTNVKTERHHREMNAAIEELANS